MLAALPIVLLPALPQAPARSAQLVDLVAQVDPRRLERTVRDLVAFGTRHTLSATGVPKRGIGAARDYLEARLTRAAAGSKGRMAVTREAHGARLRGGREIRVVNLVATIRGTEDPDRVYVVSGHYDSRNSNGRDAKGDAPGANDDGSGTAAVLELADILAGVPLRATLRLVCFDGEELGLLGSRADAGALRDRKARVDGMVTLDIVGNTEGPRGRRERGYVRAFSYQDGPGDSSGRDLARTAADCARRYLGDFRVELVFRGDRYGRGGDHRPFADAGWPAMRFTEPYENFSRQHKDVTEKDGRPYGDLPDYMDFAYLADVTRLTLALAYEVASAPPPPASLRVRGTASLGTRVFLRPQDLPDRFAGFDLVWRRTTAPDWEHRRFVPKQAADRRGLRTLLEDLLLDDSIVGARSVAADGTRSRFVSAREPGARRRSRR